MLDFMIQKICLDS